MAEPDSWPSIERKGLLSTKALLDLFSVEGKARAALLSAHRPECVQISHPHHGTAVIRDQKPMDDAGLRRALQDGLSPKDWYRLLNERVFFWVTKERLERFMNAKAYRGQRKTVITVDTAALLERHGKQVELSPINSGCTKPYPHKRGRNTFLPISRYPFDEWNGKRGGIDPIVELAVKQGVEDIRQIVIKVEEVGGALPNRILVQREGPIL